jgi:ribonuclease BN (tRNA processing enzyme)
LSPEVATLTFLGVGSATDFELGPTSVLYRGSSSLLVDCGPQSPAACVRLGLAPEDLDGIYVTHRHADHCFGLASLLLWLRVNGRRRALPIFAAAPTLAALQALLDLGAPGAFTAKKGYAIEWTELAKASCFPFSRVELRIAPTAHNVENFAVRIDDGPHRVAISGDGLLTAQTLALYDGCNVVVQECAYAERSHPAHMNLALALEMFHAVRPNWLLLTHCLAEQRRDIASRVERAMEAAGASSAGERILLPQPGDVISL